MIITPYSLDLAARVIRVLGTPSQCLKAGRLGLYQLKVVPSRLVSDIVFGSTAWWFLYWPVSGRPPLITSKRPFFFGHCLLEMGGHVNMSHTLNFSRAGGAIPKVHRHAHETWLSSMCIYIYSILSYYNVFFFCCCCCPDPRATCRKQQQYVCFMRFFPISKYPYYQVFGVKKKKRSTHSLSGNLVFHRCRQP